jgi:hypothetical protein
MSVATEKARILQILTLPPVSVKSATTLTLRQANQWPSAVCITRQADYDYTPSSDMKIIQRDYEIIILVNPIQTGRALDVENEADVYFQTVPQLFQLHDSLQTEDNTNPLQGVQRAYLIGDGGFYVEELNAQWIGAVSFTLRVESYAEVELGL